VVRAALSGRARLTVEGCVEGEAVAEEGRCVNEGLGAPRVATNRRAFELTRGLGDSRLYLRLVFFLLYARRRAEHGPLHAHVRRVARLKGHSSIEASNYRRRCQ